MKLSFLLIACLATTSAASNIALRRKLFENDTDTDSDGGEAEVAAESVSVKIKVDKISCKSAGVPEPIACGDTIYDKVTLTSNIKCFGLERVFTVDGGTLDCNGKVLLGNSAAKHGIILKNGGTVKNCIITGFDEYGIRVQGNDNTIEGSIIEGIVSGRAIYMENANSGTTTISGVQVLFNNGGAGGIGAIQVAETGLGSVYMDKVSVISNVGYRAGIYIEGGCSPTGGKKNKKKGCATTLNEVNVIGNGGEGIEFRESTFPGDARVFIKKLLSAGNEKSGLNFGNVRYQPLEGYFECKDCIFHGNGEHGLIVGPGGGKPADTGINEGKLEKIIASSNGLVNSGDGIRLMARSFGIDVKAVNVVGNNDDGLEHGPNEQGAVSISNVVAEYNGDNGLQLDGWKHEMSKTVFSCFNTNYDIKEDMSSYDLVVNDLPICNNLDSNDLIALFSCVEGCPPNERRATTDKCVDP